MTFEFEGLGRRTLASLIDNLTWLFAVLWLLSFFPESAFEDHPEAVGLVMLVLLSAWFNYFAFAEWRWGQTIGKNAMGMRVIAEDRGRISFGQASIRNLLRLVDFFLIGELLIATDRRRQRLGDKAAHTVVVRDPRSKRGTRHYSATPHRIEDREEAPAPAPPGAPAPAGGGRMPTVGWDISQTVWGLIGGLFLGGLFAPLLVLPFDPNLDSDGALLVAQALFAGSLIFVAVGIASRWSFTPLREALGALGMRATRLSSFGVALLTLFLYYFAVGLFALLIAKPDQQDIGGDLGVNDPSVIVAASAVLLIAVVAPVSEELFFRGMVFGGLRARYSLWPAALLSGLAFGLPHVFTGPIAAVPLAGLGVALAWLYDRTGSIWPCIFIHMINNALALGLA